MNDKSIRIKRKQASFLLFYRQIFIFSILIAIIIFLVEYYFGFINPDMSTLIKTVLYFIKRFSFRLPADFFIGSLLLTHNVQKNQYYYYRNQGCTIKSLIIMSWVLNCFIGILLLLLCNNVGQNG